jgi:hypothetical protein
LPLWIDITNPTSASGWENKEYDSLLSRPHPDTILSLALLHHLVFTYNLNFSMIATFFSKLCKTLIIEFIPKSDSNAKKLIQNRDQIFRFYTQDNFKSEFSKHFVIKKIDKLLNSQRTLYLMDVKKNG